MIFESYKFNAFLLDVVGPITVRLRCCYMQQDLRVSHVEQGKGSMWRRASFSCATHTSDSEPWILREVVSDRHANLKLLYVALPTSSSRYSLHVRDGKTPRRLYFAERRSSQTNSAFQLPSWSSRLRSGYDMSSSLARNSYFYSHVEMNKTMPANLIVKDIK